MNRGFFLFFFPIFLDGLFFCVLNLTLTPYFSGCYVKNGRMRIVYLSERGHLPVNMARIFNFVKIGDKLKRIHIII